jgi:hypothetical protein
MGTGLTADAAQLVSGALAGTRSLEGCLLDVAYQFPTLPEGGELRSTGASPTSSAQIRLLEAPRERRNAGPR